MSKIRPCLWFDRQAEEAASFYVSLLPRSSVDRVNRGPADWPAGKAGDVLGAGRSRLDACPAAMIQRDQG